MPDSRCMAAFSLCAQPLDAALGKEARAQGLGHTPMAQTDPGPGSTPLVL